MKTCITENLNLQTSCVLYIEKYFKMKKSDCKEALEIYKRFLTRVTKIGEFMKLAEVRDYHLYNDAYS